MTQVHTIRKLYLEEGKNISQILQETGHDRKTVRAYLEKEDWNEKKPTLHKEAEFPKLDLFKRDINNWLEEDKKAKRKQRPATHDQAMMYTSTQPFLPFHSHNPYPSQQYSSHMSQQIHLPPLHPIVREQRQIQREAQERRQRDWGSAGAELPPTLQRLLDQLMKG